MKLLPRLCLLILGFGSAFAQEIRPGVVTVSEGEDALLPCALDSEHNINQFDWTKDNGEEEKMEVFFYKEGIYYGHGRSGQSEQFRGRIVFFEDELKSGNASIKIKNTRLDDNGTYTCVLFEPPKNINIWLNVVGDLKIRNSIGAAPLPYINQIPMKNVNILLECKAQGVPKPEVEWRNSAGEGFPTEYKHVLKHKDTSGRFHVQLSMNVTRSDTYTCVVTQREIYHQINRTVNVLFQEQSSTSGVVAVAISITSIIFLLVFGIIIAVLCVKIQSLKALILKLESKPLNDITSS